ncbi:MAG: HK97 family phage prohead protease, partial [Deinococcota bacterium]
MSKEQRRQAAIANFEIRSLTDEGVFEAYATVFNVVDSYDTLFKQGCFAKTIKDKRGIVPILDEHYEEIGLTSALVEDNRGLLITGRLYLGDNERDEVKTARE